MNRVRTQAGFSLLGVTITMMVAIVAALVIIDLIKDDQEMAVLQRQHQEAREAAEGGLMEILNDQGVMVRLPSTDTPGLAMKYAPSSFSRFGARDNGKGVRDYTADIRLVRVTPLLESSHSVVRAVVYDVRVEATQASGAGAGVHAEVYKIATGSPGYVAPRQHAR